MAATATVALDSNPALRVQLLAESDSALVDPAPADRIRALEKQFYDFDIAIGQADR